jgi:hypothetical protein
MPAKKKTALTKAQPPPYVKTPSDVSYNSEKVSQKHIVSARIIGTFPNPIWKKATLEDGTQIKVRVPNRFVNRLHNKVVEVQRIDGELDEYYKYEP